MNTRPLKITTIALGFGAALFSGANIVWASNFGSDGDQKTYQLAAKQDTTESYLYIDLQNGEVIKTPTMWRCEDAGGQDVKKYVELPTGKIWHWNCRK